MKNKIDKTTKSIILIGGLTLIAGLFLLFYDFIKNYDEYNYRNMVRSCNSRGLEVETKYTKEGDKYYECKGGH